MTEPVPTTPIGYSEQAPSRFVAIARGLLRRVETIPVVGPLARKGLKLGWWTVSGQLPARLRARQAVQIPQPAPPDAPAREPLPLVEVIDPATFVVPLDDNPIVSVIVPTYGQVAYTLGCLASIAAHKPRVGIEVLVMDDAFPGEEVDTLRQVRGIRLIRNEKNLGFLLTCNAAARAARGKYLLFLNNDTQVLDGWLDPMLDLFDRWKDVGAVGARLLFPDGTQQEAGGIIWRNATGWNFGRGADPAGAVYNYVREVDYCSGAALLVRRDVFDRLGGFDERFVPAYCEDSDLCFRIRQAGLKVLYQPRAQVVHYEGMSHGTDVKVGVKAYQIRNEERFREYWGKVLAADHYYSGTQVMRARDRAAHRKVVMIVDHRVPEPDRDAGSRTQMAFIEALLADNAVVKFWPHDRREHQPHTETLRQMGVEVLAGNGHGWMDEWLRENGPMIDLVIVNRPDITLDSMSHIRRYTRCRVVYYGHDLHFRRVRLQGEGDGDDAMLREADRLEAAERDIWRNVDVVLYPSEEEARIVRQMDPAATSRSITPYAFSSFGVPCDPPAVPQLMFVAGFDHPPNEAALVWFVDTILPILRETTPGVRLAVVGSNPTARVRGLADEVISVHPDVSDEELAAWYGRARVAVVPLLYGAGVKMKVVEAMARGLPVVTTPVGAQGLEGIEDFLPVAQVPADFAAHVTRLLQDAEAWRRQQVAQLDYARAHFSVEAFRRDLRAALADPAAKAA